MVLSEPRGLFPLPVTGGCLSSLGGHLIQVHGCGQPSPLWYSDCLLPSSPLTLSSVCSGMLPLTPSSLLLAGTSRWCARAVIGDTPRALPPRRGRHPMRPAVQCLKTLVAHISSGFLVSGGRRVTAWYSVLAGSGSPLCITSELFSARTCTNWGAFLSQHPRSFPWEQSNWRKRSEWEGLLIN